MPSHFYRPRCEASRNIRSAELQKDQEKPTTSARPSEAEHTGNAAGKEVFEGHLRKLGKAITVGALCVAMVSPDPSLTGAMITCFLSERPPW